LKNPFTSSNMTTKHYRACNLCEAICGLEITLDDGQITAIKGDAQDPFSRGHICPKALALKDIYLDKNRLKQPLKRVSGGWETISWEEAFDTVVAKIKETQSTYGNDSVAMYAGNPSIHNLGTMIAGSGFTKLLNTKSRFTATSLDQLPHHFLAWQLYGHPMLMPIPDIDHTDLWVIFGGNPIVSNGSIMTAPDVAKRLHAIQKRGGKVIVIDPRRTETADKANQHVFVRPGGDIFLLLGMIHVLFDENLVNLKHLASFTDGLDKIAQIITDFSPQLMAQHAGVEESVIRQLARDIAAAPRAAVYGRVGVSVQQYGTLCHWAINLLNIFTGNLDSEGGMMFTQPAFDILAKAKPKEAYFGRWHSKVRQLPEFMGELPSPALAEEITHPEGIKMLIVSAGNPVLSSPNGQKLDEALESLDFMVSIDIYLNETSRHADIILPPTTGLETSHYDITFHHLAIRNTAKFSQPLFEKTTEQRHDWEIFQELTARMTSQKPQPIPPTIPLDFMLQSGTHKLSLQQLKDNPHGIDLGPLQPCLPERLFTSDKRINLAVSYLMDDLARVHEAITQPQTDPKAGELLLISRRELRDNNSWMHNAPVLMKGRNRCTLMIHPDTAQNLGIAEGTQVEVSSRVGTVRLPATLTAEVMPDVVCMPHGYGHARKGVQMDVASQYAGVSINDLTDEEFLDDLTGTVAFSGVKVTVMAVC
jgi:anaerobic selenocysteine-containing dehydrogenase